MKKRASALFFVCRIFVYCITTGTTIGAGTGGHSGEFPQGFSGVMTSSAAQATAVLDAIIACAVTG